MDQNFRSPSIGKFSERCDPAWTIAWRVHAGKHRFKAPLREPSRWNFRSRPDHERPPYPLQQTVRTHDIFTPASYPHGSFLASQIQIPSLVTTTGHAFSLPIKSLPL